MLKCQYQITWQRTILFLFRNNDKHIFFFIHIHTFFLYFSLYLSCTSDLGYSTFFFLGKMSFIFAHLIENVETKNNSLKIN
jgi:hypothetical protein